MTNFSIIKSKKGMDPLIASVLTILFGVLMLAVVLTVVNPLFNRAEDSSVISDAFQNLNLLDSAITEVSSEAQGSKRTVAITVSNGEYSINSTTDMLIFEFDPSEDMQLTGRKGDIYIQHGNVFLDFFNWYVNGGLAAPVWKNTSGRWVIDSYKYKGIGGLTYINLSIIDSYKFTGDIYNSSGPAGGQIFVLPMIPERLVGFWPFDNRTGSRAYDYSGRQNNGTLTNMNTTGNTTSGWQSSSNCKAGNSCLMFDGVNDLVNMSNVSGLSFTTNDFTISLWLKSDDAGASKGLVDRRNTALTGYMVYMDAGTIHGYINQTAAVDFSISNTVNDGTWHHVVVVFDRSSNGLIYVDGVSRTVTGGDISGQSGDISNIGESTIGYRSAQATASPITYFNGSLDEVRVWNVALTSEEVTAEYELSAKKITGSGGDYQSVSAKTNASLVLANPDGVTSFDNIMVERSRKEQMFLIPYSKVDLNGTMRIVKGDYRVAIEHMGTNTTSNRPVVQITS